MKRAGNVLKGLIALAVLAGLGWAAWAFWLRSDETAQAQNDLSQVFTVRRGDISASVSATGEVYARQQKQLAFNVSGIPLTEVHVTMGQSVKAGEVLARIDTSTLKGALDKAEANYLTAEDALEKAQNPYTETDLRRLEAAVTQAQYNLDSARQNLEDLLDPDLAAAERKVREARASLLTAQDSLASLKADPSVQENIEYLQWQYNELEVQHGQLLNNSNPSEKQQDYLWLVRNQLLDAREALARAKIQAQLDLLKAEHEVTAAEDALADAREALADLQDGPEPDDVTTARNAVAQAEYDLKRAQEELETAKAGPDATAIKRAQAQYDSAKATYEEAQLALAGVTLVAPFDGTVTKVNAEVGDLVSPSLAVVTVADLTDLRVRASIDETKITQIEVGQAVEITFDAFPGQKFQGQVLEVPLEGSLVNNVVVYTVVISLDDASEVALKPGMTANLTIKVGEKTDVLLVPAMAVKQSTEGAVVSVQEADGTVANVPVQIGLSDGTYVEIVRGLNEGDLVMVEYQEQEEQQGFFGPGGGGAPPPMAAPGGAP